MVAGGSSLEELPDAEGESGVILNEETKKPFCKVAQRVHEASP